MIFTAKNGQYAPVIWLKVGAWYRTSLDSDSYPMKYEYQIDEYYFFSYPSEPSRIPRKISAFAIAENIREGKFWELLDDQKNLQQ